MNLLKFSLITVLSFFLINLIICTISRKHLTYKGLSIILISLNFILLISNLYFWKYFVFNSYSEIFNYKLNSNNWTNINYEICVKINVLNFLFVFLVNIIGFCTNIYILNYFKYEERLEEFILLINWFIFSMIFLVISNNFFSLILGWELIGLTSFLLINFWKFKSTTLACSFKAFTFNKVSDIFLMIGLAILWNMYKINNIDTLLTVISLNTSNNNSKLLLAGVCLLLSSCIKSAQIIGHLWLPDSMEAPVPASSLIHSATLVSAGIYLILKFNIIFTITGLTNIIFAVGSFTACYGGLTAAAQSDMKKLLAYSTISHCGFIFASISLNNFIVTIIYLYLHGLFKAMTFFCAGSIIKVNNTQETRLMGMLKNQLIHCITLIISTINLAGLPFTFGYMYKLLFLKFLIISYTNIIWYGFLITGMLCSVVYAFKIIYYSCFDYRKGNLLINFLQLQNDTNYDNFNFNFNIFKYIAFIIIFVFSLLFFFIIKLFILKNFLFFSTNNKTLINDYLFLNKCILNKSILISIFYRLFSFVIVILINLNTRNNVSSDDINQMMCVFIIGLILLGILVQLSVYYTSTKPMTCFNHVCNFIFSSIKKFYHFIF